MYFNADLNLRTIYRELQGIDYKWFKIGIQLGIPRSKLLEFKGDPCPLSAVIEYWLKGNVTEPNTPISWKSIVMAVRYEQETQLAEKISMQYCQQGQNFDFVLGQLSHFCHATATDDSPLPATPEQKREYSPTTDQAASASQLAPNAITSSYVKRLQSIIEAKGVSPESLRYFILSLMSESKSDLEKCTTICEIFTFLSTKHATSLSNEIFEQIVKRYEINEEEILQYSKPENAKIDTMQNTTPSVFKVKMGTKSGRLVDIDEPKTFRAEIRTPPSRLQMATFQRGSDKVTLLNLPYTPSTRFSQQQEDKFQAASIPRKECNGDTSDKPSSDYPSKREHCHGNTNNPCDSSLPHHAPDLEKKDYNCTQEAQPRHKVSMHNSQLQLSLQIGGSIACSFCWSVCQSIP